MSETKVKGKSPVSAPEVSEMLYVVRIDHALWLRHSVQVFLDLGYEIRAPSGWIGDYELWFNGELVGVMFRQIEDAVRFIATR